MKFAAILVITSLMLSLSSSLSAQEKITWKEQVLYNVNDLAPKDLPIKGSNQGFAIHKNYAFSFHDKGQVIVTDIKRKKFISTFRLPDKTTHANNAVFSGRYLSNNSKYPLIYVSECKGTHSCTVYDITENGASPVQKIYYTSEGYPGSYDWFLDEKNNQICTYGGNNKGTIKTIRRFPLPDINLKEVHYTPKEQVGHTLEISNLLIFQGSRLDGDRLYLTEGYPPHKLKLHIYEYPSMKQISEYDVTSAGLEPEGVDIVGKWLYVSFHKQGQPRNNTIKRYRIK